MSEQEQFTGLEDALQQVGFIRSFVENSRFTSERVRHSEQRLFFEGAGRQAELERYTLLLLLSAAIATDGVLGESSATVIGAMIIAPLMRPIMATAAGLVMGDQLSTSLDRPVDLELVVVPSESDVFETGRREAHV